MAFSSSTSVKPKLTASALIRFSATDFRFSGKESPNKVEEAADSAIARSLVPVTAPLGFGRWETEARSRVPSSTVSPPSSIASPPSAIVGGCKKEKNGFSRPECAFFSFKRSDRRSYDNAPVFLRELREVGRVVLEGCLAKKWGRGIFVVIGGIRGVF